MDCGAGSDRANAAIVFCAVFLASPSLSLAARPAVCAWPGCPALNCGLLSGTPMRWFWKMMLSWRERRCLTSMSGGNGRGLAAWSPPSAPLPLFELVLMTPLGISTLQPPIPASGAKLWLVPISALLSPSSRGKAFPKLACTEVRGLTLGHRPILYRTSHQCNGISGWWLTMQ